MVNPTENLADRKFVPTQPFDRGDLPRFGQLIETVKDVFVKELTEFFDIYSASDRVEKRVEIKNIQKYSLSASANDLETAVNIITSYADTPDKFPLIAITSVSNRERKMNLGSNFVSHVQYPASVCGTKVGPFSLSDGDTIEITTRPLGTAASAVVSTITFSSEIFSDLTNLTIDEIIYVLNQCQALYYTASKTSEGYLRLETGGRCAKPWPNYIEVTGGDTAALAAFGLTLGDSDDYTSTSNPPKNRYGISGDITVNLDIYTDSINTRTELADLVFSFFAFYMEKRKFQFLGRSYQDRELTPPEWWHIVLQNQFSWSGESQEFRQGQEAYDMIYAMRGTVNVVAFDYVDRELVTSPVFLESSNVSASTTMPDGDYGGRNYLKNA